MSVVTKKKRVSKKTKLSWRKHVNINDVEEFLEDKRLEERLGPPVSTLSNDELFQLDTKPSEVKPIRLSRKEEKRLKFQQPPRCFIGLRPHTNVPDPIKKRNIPKEKPKDTGKHVIVKPSEIQAVNDRRSAQIERGLKPKRGQFDFSMWDQEDKKLPVEQDAWITTDAKKHNMAQTGNKRRTVRNVTKPKTSGLPAVDIPHPGMSYNPSFEDHQDLLKLVAEKEQAIIKEEEHLNRVTKDMFNKVTENKRSIDWIEEMSQGLSAKDKDEQPDSNEYTAINPPVVRDKKKTVQQRRKQKEQRKLKIERQALKREKKKVSDLHVVRTLNKKIESKDKKAQVLNEKRREKMETLKRTKTKRLALLKFEESDLEFQMGPDISGNLRNLNRQGNLLADRMKSLQKRNIVHPTVKTYRKKSKVKVFTKSGHKEDWVKTVAKKLA